MTRCVETDKRNGRHKRVVGVVEWRSSGRHTSTSTTASTTTKGEDVGKRVSTTLDSVDEIGNGVDETKDRTEQSKEDD